MGRRINVFLLVHVEVVSFLVSSQRVIKLSRRQRAQCNNYVFTVLILNRAHWATTLSVCSNMVHIYCTFWCQRADPSGLCMCAITALFFFFFFFSACHLQLSRSRNTMVLSKWCFYDFEHLCFLTDRSRVLQYCGNCPEWGNKGAYLLNLSLSPSCAHYLSPTLSLSLSLTRRSISLFPFLQNRWSA